MSRVVLDASALLALINNEPGADQVAALLSHSVISAVNVAEVLTILKSLGMDILEAQSLLHELLQSVVDFDMKQAVLVADLKEKTKKWGLSLGDRTCLALGILYECPVITADKIWKDIILDLEVKIIR